MGQDKRHLIFCGKSLFHHALQALESVFSEIIIVFATISQVVGKLSHRVETDLIPGKGSAGGLYTGLSFASNPQVFTVACDMPFLNPVVIRKVCQLSDNNDVTMVKLFNGLHPMHSVYSKQCVPVLHRMITVDQLRIQDLLLQQDLKTKILGPVDIENVDPQFRSFLNVNTPADLKIAEQLIRP